MAPRYLKATFVPRGRESIGGEKIKERSRVQSISPCVISPSRIHRHQDQCKSLDATESMVQHHFTMSWVCNHHIIVENTVTGQNTIECTTFGIIEELNTTYLRNSITSSPPEKSNKAIRRYSCFLRIRWITL